MQSNKLGPPPPSLVDGLTGLIPLVIEAEMGRGYPEVFVIATDMADTRVYGLPHEVASKGSGAGLTYEAAWWAAVGESAERYAATIIHSEDLVLDTYEGLHRRGQRAVEPERWGLFAPFQQETVPFPPFTKDTLVAWVAAENLTRRDDELVPACMVYLPHHPFFFEQGEQIVAVGVSTGAACAPSRTEALLKGVCELIERDAFMIMWRNRLPCPRVRIDPASALYAVFQEKFARPGLEYTIVNTTLDLGLPSFCGMLRDARTGGNGIVVGGAAHPDPNVAVLKTLLELVQGLRWKDHMGVNSFEIAPDYDNIRSFEDRARMYAFNDMREAFAFLWEHPHEIPLSTIRTLDAGDPYANLNHCIQLLGGAGLDVIGVDLTTVDSLECGLYVTKALIPGCEIMEGDHRCQYLGGRRWREVPHRLGLRPEISSFDSLNPYPHPYP